MPLQGLQRDERIPAVVRRHLDPGFRHQPQATQNRGPASVSKVAGRDGASFGRWKDKGVHLGMLRANGLQQSLQVF